MSGTLTGSRWIWKDGALVPWEDGDLFPLEIPNARGLVIRRGKDAVSGGGEHR